MKAASLSFNVANANTQDKYRKYYNLSVEKSIEIVDKVGIAAELEKARKVEAKDTRCVPYPRSGWRQRNIYYSEDLPDRLYHLNKSTYFTLDLIHFLVFLR